MDALTMYVGQGALLVVRHSSEAVIVDSHVPDASDDSLNTIGATLERVLRTYTVRGLILTGFDADHSHPDGVDLILTKFSPNWVMYPKCYKDTDSADAVFKVIDKHVNRRQSSQQPLRKESVRLDKLDSRMLTGLADNFTFELFSPHVDDMDNSNNSSIVLKLTGTGAGGFSYLITGDTENDRWERINQLFKTDLRSDVLAAPHHGSINGTNAETILLVHPNTVLISAGVDNQYGHPDPQAVQAYSRVAKHVFATNVEGGVSLFTKPNGTDFETLLIRP